MAQYGGYPAWNNYQPGTKTQYTGRPAIDLAPEPQTNPYVGMLTPEDKKDMRTMMLLQTGLGLLSNNRSHISNRMNPASIIGQGFSGYQQGLSALEGQRMRAQQFDMQRQQFEAEQKARQAEAAEALKQREAVAQWRAGMDPSSPEYMLSGAFPGKVAGEQAESLFDVPDTQEPFTLSPGAQRYSPTGDLIAEAPFKSPSETGFSLSPGARRYDAAGNLIAEAPPAEAKPSASRYQNSGAYVDQETGEFLGEGVFDKQSGVTKLRKADGTTVPLPASARPRTDSGLDKNAMTGNQFYALASEASQEEKSVRELARYVENLGEGGQGFDLLADQLAGQFNTLFGRELTPEQYRTMLQNGQLQGLLGGYRQEVVGGGVLTEQDAKRVLARLGGDVSLLRNKKVATKLLKEMMQEKVERYNTTLVPTYNAQLDIIPRGAFSPKERIEIDESIFEVSGDAVAGGPPPNANPEVLELWDALTPEERQLFLESE